MRGKVLVTVPPFGPIHARIDVVSENTSQDGQEALPGLAGTTDPALAREIDELRMDNARLRRLLELSEAEARAAHPDQPVLAAVAMPTGPVTYHSDPETKVQFYQALFHARTDVYATRWENTRDGR